MPCVVLVAPGAAATRGVLGRGSRAHAAVAPVGLAWEHALTRRPQLDLWAGDGTHPSRAGSYLAACVFYSVLTRRSPVGNPFVDGLPPALARFLQRLSVTA